MFDIFYQHLILHNKVAVPGFGTFTVVRQPAQHHFNKMSFAAPVWEVIFKKEDVTLDNAIYNYVSRQQQIDQEEATKRLNNFMFEIKRELSVYKTLTWPRIGLLTETASGEYELKTDNHLHIYFPDTPARRVVRENGDKSLFVENASSPTESLSTTQIADEIVVPKNDWWIDAIILTILAVAAIGYYFLKNGTIR